MSLARSAELWRSLELRAPVAHRRQRRRGAPDRVLPLPARVEAELHGRRERADGDRWAATSRHSLEKAGISYQLRDGGGTVAVEKAQVTTARVTLAPGTTSRTAATPAYELFDTKSLGSTDFEQKVKYPAARSRAEIARTIESDRRTSARRRCSSCSRSSRFFLDDGTKASARRPALERQACSTRRRERDRPPRLLETSEGLKAEDVTINDENGSLLLAERRRRRRRLVALG